jgi:hypothetical protein
LVLNSDFLFDEMKNPMLFNLSKDMSCMININSAKTEIN